MYIPVATGVTVSHYTVQPLLSFNSSRFVRAVHSESVKRHERGKAEIRKSRKSCEQFENHRVISPDSDLAQLWYLHQHFREFVGNYRITAIGAAFPVPIAPRT
jgi:hypothetical protein